MVKQIIFMGNNGAGRHAWNIDAHVGLRAPNNRADVDLVQLAYLAMSQNPKLNLGAEQRDALAQLKVGQPCTGAADDPLVRIIQIHQKNRGGTQDGKVSPIATQSGVYQDKGAHLYMMVVLNNNLLDMIPFGYPRIDQHKDCPPTLKKAILESYDLPGFLALQ